MALFRLFSIPAVLVSVALISSSVRAATKNEFSEYSAKNLDGQEVSFEKYKNKCVLVVNTASGCGLTTKTMNYLNELRADPEFKDLDIVAIPTNTFNQEPKTNAELKEFFYNKWNAKYDVYEKVDNLKDSEIFQFLGKSAGDKYPIWNYGKYVVEKNGKAVTLYGPQSGTFIDWGFKDNLKKCLKA